jgi:hypothetical protein
MRGKKRGTEEAREKREELGKREADKGRVKKHWGGMEGVTLQREE